MVFHHFVSKLSSYFCVFSPLGVAQIEKARPYFEALEIANKAQKECQSAATAYQRANGIHAAAKETISLAEDRFLTNSSSWQFDNAWQEMLNHATMKVIEFFLKKYGVFHLKVKLFIVFSLFFLQR